MTRQAEPGDTCVNCGQRVRAIAIDTSGLDSAFDTSIPGVTCGCEGLQGPQVAD